MIIDFENATELGLRDYPTLPDPKSGVRGVSALPGFPDLEVLEQKMPETLGDDAMVRILYSSSLLRGGKVIHTASIEEVDLSLISSASGIPLRTLQKEHGVKGYTLQAHIILYGNGEREDLGPYLGSMADEDVFPFLSDLLSDSISSGDEDISEWLFDEE